MSRKLLLLLMLCTMMFAPVVVQAQEVDFETTEPSAVDELVEAGSATYSWNAASKTLTISGSGECICPQQYIQDVQKVIIQSGITSIGSNAFCVSQNLSSVSIPESVKSIDFGAFQNCTNLSTINLPNGLTTIGAAAFIRCESLSSINIPASVTTIENGAFSDCINLSKIIIPNDKTTLGNEAFKGCTKLNSAGPLGSGCNMEIGWKDEIRSLGWPDYLTSVSIPNSVTSLNGSFASCTRLTSVNIPNSVTSLNGTFNSCSSLTSVNIPNGVTVLNGTFFGCSSLSTISIPTSVTLIDFNSFSGCSNLTSITIPDSVTEIHQDAFKNCTKLTDITLSKKLSRIYDNVFEGCSSLTAITIPGSIAYIGPGAFSGCTSLTNITIPKSAYILNDTFKGCTSLRSVNLPSDLSGIKDNAFNGCTSLSSLLIPASAEEIGPDAFLGCANLTIKGYANSYAEQYAKSHSIPFQLAGKSFKVTFDWKVFTDYNFYPQYCIVIQGEEYGFLPEAASTNGNVFIGWYTKKEGGEKITSTSIVNLSGDQVLYPHWSSSKPPVPGLPFTDIVPGQYYIEPIKYAYSHNITTGTSATSFKPNGSCTRGQAVTFIWRAMGKPEPKNMTSKFADVQNPSMYYYKAVLWAAENGITTGTTATTFSPDSYVTRSQFVTFLYRAKGKAPTVSNPFTDVSQEKFYYAPVLWAVETGVTTGTTASTFEPEARCTRAQVVTFIYRAFN